jgi:D-erythrose 4-phosphate dehydrogenase
MIIRAAINGYGRIGRCILRAVYESAYRDRIQIVGINELSGLESLVHLTRFDSTHGRFAGDVSHIDGAMYVNGDKIEVFCEHDIQCLDWDELGVDVVFECSGSFSERIMAQQHLDSGAGKVIFSSPATRDVDATVVYGFNEDVLKKEHKIISNASCTTNCSAHVIDLLDTNFGIEQGVVTIVHSSMNDQPVIDAYHNPDLRKSRSSLHSIIPVSTGLAQGIERLFPHLVNRFEAVSLRVPTMNVSMMQLSVNVTRTTSATEVNDLLREISLTKLKGIVDYTELPLVSCDFNHNSCSAVIDGCQTLVSGNRLVTVIAWFDNEWGYANRILDTALAAVNAG